MTLRARHLVESILQDDPHLASDIIFPRDAFVALRDTRKGSTAWDKTIANPFARAIHSLHRKAKGLARAQFVAIELGHPISQVPPQKREWKAPVWRVRHSRITLSIDGHIQRIDIPEMVGWRGAWYVTKLR